MLVKMRCPAPMSSMGQTPGRRLRHRGPRECLMKFVNLYLIGYVILVVGVALALWQSGILSRISGMWIAIGAIVAVGLGIMMSVSSGKPDITRGA
jgi:hypothetical protein